MELNLLELQKMVESTRHEATTLKTSTPNPAIISELNSRLAVILNSYFTGKTLDESAEDSYLVTIYNKSVSSYSDLIQKCVEMENYIEDKKEGEKIMMTLNYLKELEDVTEDVSRASKNSIGRGHDVVDYANNLYNKLCLAIRDYVKNTEMDVPPYELQLVLDRGLMGIFDYCMLDRNVDSVNEYIKNERKILNDSIAQNEKEEKMMQAQDCFYEVTDEILENEKLMNEDGSKFNETLNSLAVLRTRVDQLTGLADSHSESASELMSRLKSYIEHHIFDDEYSDYLKDANANVENDDDYDTVVGALTKVNSYIDRVATDIVDSVKQYIKEKEENMVLCDCCNDMISIDDAEEIASGVYVCDRCREHYYTCDECGSIHHEDDMHWVERESISVCDDCYDRHFGTCQSCGEILRASDMISDSCGDYYCESCYDERYTSCDNCGCEIDRDYAYWTDDGCYCEDCYSECSGPIHDYHDDIDWSVKTFLGEPINENTFTIGIEHEVAGDTSYAQEFADIVNPKYEEENCVLMHDSSVDGFEIITQPMTLNYFRYVFMPAYKKGIEFLKAHRFVGEDEGGIHIHFSEVKDPVKLAKLCNVLYGTIDDAVAWAKIANRTEYKLNRWASVTNREHTTTEILSGEFHRASENRYTALNYDGCRTETHELRIFNSTVDADDYVTCVDILLSLLDFIEIDTGRGVYVTTRDYVEYIKNHKEDYPLVYKRMENKEVFNLYGLDDKDIEILPVNDVELDDIDLAVIDEVVNAMDAATAEADSVAV